MPTTNITINPVDGWVVVFTATTETRVSIEKVNGGAYAMLAIDSVTPSIIAGHSLKSLKMQPAVLFAGESLYARCSDNLTPAILAVTR